MEQHKIDRINELAKKHKAEGLTEEEVEERARLRAEYVASFRENLAAQLENTYVCLLYTSFPSRYCFSIGHQVVFRLGWWSTRVPTGFHVSGGTLDTRCQSS